MERREAFAYHGARGIHRQWHLQAADGVEVVSIWEYLIEGDEAEAHIHKKHFANFHKGMRVRAVIQRGTRDPDTGVVKAQDAEPDPNQWAIVAKEIQMLENSWLRQLHVIKLCRKPEFV